MDIRLVNITKENYQQIVNLKVAPEQQVFTVRNVQALVEATFERGRVALAIVEQQRQACIGLLVHGPGEIPGSWWLYHLMVNAEEQHQGYGRIAVGQLVTQLADTPAVKYLYACYHATNAAAHSLAVQLGFEETGNVREEHIEVALHMPAKTRPVPNITLRDVTLENARACMQLQVAPNQAQFVASNAESLVQSKFEPHWLTKAIYNDEVMVGFVMYGYDPEFGWGILRLMVAAPYQGRGYGRAAMRRVLAQIQAEGGLSVGVSYEADNVTARQLYHSLGFVETGEQPFGEPFAVLILTEHTH